MYWYWYARRTDELLLDLDKANDKRVFGLCSKLGGAIRDGKLDVERWTIVPSTSDDNVHVMVSLSTPMLNTEAIAWELYLLSDRYRAMMNLFRAVKGEAWPIVLIEPWPVPGWRDPDGYCLCPVKHDNEQMALCKLAALTLDRKPAHAFTGKPDPDNWHKTLGEGLRT